MFFQQDEWLVFGLVISQGPELVIRGLFSSTLAHFIPVTNALNYLLFNIFGLNYSFYAVLGAFIHLLNGFLVYLLAKRLVKGKLLPLVASVVFISLSAASQLTMWAFVNLSMLSLTFTLLAWIQILKIKSQKQISWLRSFYVLIFVALAILTLENAAGILIFLPMAILALSNEYPLGKLLKLLMPITTFGFFYILFRFLPILVGANLESAVSPQTPDFLYNAISFPLRYVGQLVINQEGLIQLLTSIKKLPLSVFEEHDIETSFFQLTSVAIGAVVFIISGASYLKARKTSPKVAKNIALVLGFLFVNSLPFIFIPGRTGSFYIFASRYLYFGLAGMGLLVALLADTLFLGKRGKLGVVFISVTAFMIISGIAENNIRMDRLYKEGTVRREVLANIKSNYPKLPKRVIFYTESDRSYYGIAPEERLMPFQSGFGQTLLVWYHQTEMFPKEFFEDKERFLWEITDQGYQKVGGRGFGYFRDFDLMYETIEEENLAPSSVIAFRYGSINQIAENMTEEIRGRIAGRKTPKRVIAPSTFRIEASQNPDEINMSVDGQRETKWDSKLPYAYPQFLAIDLGESRKIAQVRLDSYNNRDQNAVGYSVLLSDDGEKWRQVFYAKRYPPSLDGFTDLFFEPQFSRFIKLEQRGEHQFASWVIHELNVYEAIN